MKSKIINTKGKELEESLALNEKVWNLPENIDLITQVLYVYNSNKRKGTAKTKTKAEVAGGGKKPWRQKGTGRARAGSIRSPLWIKGGRTFASGKQNLRKKINEKMKKKAIATALSSKLKGENVKFVKFSEKSEKKKIREDLISLSNNLKTLVVSENEDVLNSVQNVEKFKVAKPLNLNIFNSLDNKLIIIDSKSNKEIEERFVNEK